MTAGRDAETALSARTLISYGLPAAALAIPTIPVYVQLPSFYAAEVGLGLTAIGVALFAARLLDVVTDPLVGLLCDARPTRFGRRKPWIAAGAVLGGISMMQLFAPPAGAGVAHLFAWAALLYLGWTLVAIPYAAWGAELSADYHQRARVTSVREGAGLLGILLAGALLAAGPPLGLAATATQSAVGWAAILLGAPSLAWLLWRVPEARGAGAGGAPIPLRALAGGLWRNRPFLRLVGAWFLNGVANGLPAALFPLYVGHGLQLDDRFAGGLIFTYFASGIAAIPLWLMLSRRVGKQRAWCAAMLLCCAAFAWVPWLPPGAWPAFLLVCLVTGAALGADLALPPALQADVVDYDAWRFGRPRAGLLFALWSMATKLALAAAVGIAFPALDWAGFDAAAPANPPGAILTLTVIYALVPIVIKLITVTMVWTHPLTSRRHSAIRSRLARRATA